MNKIKGITIWEQHAEYFALGIAGLALLGFVAWQFVGEPNAVNVSGHGKITPGDVDQRLVDAAQRLDGELNPSAPPRVNVGDPRPVLPEFEAALAASISPAPRIGTLVASVPVPIGEHVRVGETFVVPSVPQPSLAVARQYFDTLADDVIDSYGLNSMFTSAPFDVSWITAAAAIDLNSVLEGYRSTGPDGSLAPVPTSWHAGQATILDVRVEREELVNGSWTRRKLIDPLPGQATYRNEIREGVDATQREMIVRGARDIEMQRAVAQPSFYATRNSAFLPPNPFETEIEISPSVDDDVANDLRRLRSLEREYADVNRRLTELGGPLTTDPGPTRPGGTTPSSPGTVSGPGDGGPGLGGAGPRGPGEAAGPAQDSGPIRARINLTRRLANLERQIEQIRSRLPVQAPSDDQSQSDDGTFVVWAHDLDVQPGSTYRYRVVVDVYNPFYLRRMNLVDEQQSLAESMVFSSPAGEWSEPIQASAPLHPFITRAYAPGQERGAVAGHGMGHAVAEVYRFYDGRWWYSQFTLEPGQRVGAVREEAGASIDFGTDWFVLDIVEDTEGDGGSSTGPGREGRAARVVLQHIISGEITEVRHPRTDLSNTDRLRLEDEIRFADVG